MFNSGAVRRAPIFFLLLTLTFLAVGVAGVIWRAGTPGDGTTVNVVSGAISGDGAVVRDTDDVTPLRTGDIVLAVDGRNIRDALATGIGGRPVHGGEVLRYDIVRDGKALSLDVALRQFSIGGNLVKGWPSLLVNIALLGTASAIFVARPREPAAHAGILASGIGVATVAWSGYFQLEVIDLVAGDQFWRWYGGQAMFALLWAGMVHFALAYPEVTDRRGHHRLVTAAYTGTLLSYALLAAFAWLFAEDPFDRLSIMGSPAIPSLYLYPFIVLLILVTKYVRGEDPLLRRRLRWLAVSLSGAAALYLCVWVIPTAVSGTPPVPMEYHTLVFLPVPIAVAMAILRHRALNIDVVLSRSLVYATLTVLLAGGYIGVVGMLSALFPPLGSMWQQAIAAAALALAVQPLRAWVQRLINVRLFGEPTDPYRVVSSLAARLEEIDTPTEQLTAMVETIGAALRLPYVAIELDRDEGSEEAAAYGVPTALSHRLPLTFQGEPIGRLVIARRSPRETLSRKERSVLAEVARHAGTVAHTARLTTDLVRSRDRLVSAREEERRQLLRELHDGVGPTLAAITLGLRASRRAIGESAPPAMLLAKLQDALNGASTEIRRLAHGLRPPALEKLGLRAAIEDYIGTIGHAPGLTVSYDAPEELPAMPPAVDVAAYRIVCESLANVTRHAKASNCTVTLKAGTDLEIEVSDDGIGLDEHSAPGFGLASMRERAAELGGRFRAGPRPGGGTTVSAALPLPPELPGHPAEGAR
ncbi:ATP-binding protein [Amycolatopsis minnesotensis]|uniref:ATP-binding protein n=1 Tax=Amycolatopsis minnesotensis TaxID=337894 RepID=UPI0031D4579D